MRNFLVASGLLLFLGSCSSCENLEKKACVTSSDCSDGRVCVDGVCQSPSDGGAEAGDGGVFAGCERSNPNNWKLDTDCDGLSDEREYSSFYANGLQTDPCRSDTDGDGLKDGLELGLGASVDATCGFIGDSEPSSQTSPVHADTDRDSLPDGAEDKNQNGQVDDGESNPIRKDTDCDGLPDSVEVAGSKGCVTNPSRVDSDGDGIPDGVEQGVTSAPGGVTDCPYTSATFDVEPTTTTNACAQDTDSDGIMDGAEDNNRNGKVDADELDPNSGDDAAGPASAACATNNLKPIEFIRKSVADVQVALAQDYAEVGALKDASGKERGAIFYSATRKVAGLVLSKAPAGGSGVEEEAAARELLRSLGTVSGSLTQTFKTWDQFENSVRASYDFAGSDDLKTRMNALAEAFLGADVTGKLSGLAAVTGPFKLFAQFVHRTDNRAVVVLALTPAALFEGNAPFHLDDVAGGSALAQFGDFALPQCEVFLTEGNRNLDFIWVVDNSASMGVYQGSVGNVANLFAEKLSNAGLNWRVAGIATDGANSTPFVTTFGLPFFVAFGTGGSHFEVPLYHAKQKTMAMLPRAANNPSRIRPDADLHIILLGDADDQAFGTSAAEFTQFFLNYDNQGTAAMVHGIVCPDDVLCGENDLTPRRNLAVISGTGGVFADISTAASPGNPATASSVDAILNAAIVSTGKQLSRPPIASTLKVAMEAGASFGACNTDDVPRSRVNGFDFDGATRRLVFYGDCRPKGSGKKVAVSYRFWNENSPFPGGEPCDNRCVSPQVCNEVSRECQCAADCGGCPESLFCNVAQCACVGLQ